MRIALGDFPAFECPALDVDESDSVAIDELIAAVSAVLQGCGKCGAGRVFGSYATTSLALEGIPYDASDLHIVDLDGDGYQDIILGGGGASRVTVVFGGAGGAFEPPKHLPGAGVATTRLTAVDVNGDRLLDLVPVANRGGVRILLQTSDRGFELPVATALAEPHCCDVAGGDLDGDDIPDLVAISSPGIGIARGLGDGTFVAVDPPPTGGSHSQIALGDIDGDGQEDIILGNRDRTVSVLLNRGQGSVNFDGEERYPGGDTGPYSTSRDILVEDLDGDSYGEILVVDERASSINVLPGSATGPETPEVIDVSMGGSLISSFIKLKDLNSDGLKDLVVMGHFHSMMVLYGQRGVLFSAPVAVEHPALGHQLAGMDVGDVDGNGLADLVTTDGRELEFYFGCGQ